MFKLASALNAMALTALLGLASLPAHADTPDYIYNDAEVPTILKDYFHAWDAFDGDKVAATFSKDGTFVDPQKPNGIRGEDLARYVESMRLSKAVTTRFVKLGDGKFEVYWDFFDSNGKKLVWGMDTITVAAEAKISSVNSVWHY